MQGECSQIVAGIGADTPVQEGGGSITGHPFIGLQVIHVALEAIDGPDRNIT